MSDNVKYSPPELTTHGSDPWEAERAAFWRLLPTLLQTHAGRYVAVYQGQVVDQGEDEIELGMRVYQKVGYVPIYVGLVSEERKLVRIPTPRVRRPPTQ